VVEDEIVIVDPASYVIVDVIPVSTQRADRPGDRPARAQLTLTPEQMRFVYANVPKDRTAELRVRLALGAEVPREVELETFPAEVLNRVPELDRFRFVVAERDVVVVDPNERAVVLVITD
jgi:hypothetical protein